MFFPFPLRPLRHFDFSPLLYSASNIIICECRNARTRVLEGDVFILEVLAYCELMVVLRVCVCVCVFVYVFICEKMHKFTLPVGGGEIPFSLYKTQNLPVYSIKVLDPRTQSLWWICERKENSLMEWPSKRTLGRCERFCIGSCSQKVEILRGFQPKVHDARAACSQPKLLHNFNYLGSCTYYLLSTCALLNEKRIRVFSRWEIFWAMLILVKFRGRVSWNASVSKFASGYTLILFIIISSWVLRFVIRLEREFLLRMKKSSSSVFRKFN